MDDSRFISFFENSVKSPNESYRDVLREKYSFVSFGFAGVSRVCDIGRFELEFGNGATNFLDSAEAFFLGTKNVKFLNDFD